MHGIVSLLDDKHYQLTESLWAELEKSFGVRGIYVTPYPHFSYQVAKNYDTTQLEPILQGIAQTAREFQVRTTGVSLFTGPSPVLYIPVVRTQALSQFQQMVWNKISQTGAGVVDYYHPEKWLPHITIGFGDVRQNNLPDIIQLLSKREINWEITVNNLSYIADTGQKQELRWRFNFGR